jgi:hypothetical protein
MPSVARSLELYWDLDDLMAKITTGSGIYLELGDSVKNAFKKGQAKHVKYIRKLEKDTMIYAAHILEPSCKSSMMIMVMGDKASAILTAVKKAFQDGTSSNRRC